MYNTPTAVLALLLIIPLSWLAFKRLETTHAVVAVLFGTSLFAPELSAFDLPASPSMDKHGISTVCMIVGVLATARKRVQLANPGRGIDLWIAAMLLGAVGTVLTNPDPLHYGKTTLPGLTVSDLVSDCIYLFLRLGTPFLLGRLLFRTAADALVLLGGLVLIAVIYTPFILIELRLSPQLHGWIYGFAQHDFNQTKREGGYRPMVFMAHGLALALFVSVSAFAAWNLVKRRYRVIGPPSVVAGGLSVLLVLMNSFGALLYGLVGVPLAWFTRPKTQIRVAAVLAVLIALYPVLRATGSFPTQKLVDLSAMKSQDRAASLTYRFNQEDAFLEKAKERPIFGWGGWARGHIWNEQGQRLSVLDGAWLGMLQRGAVGLTTQFVLLLAPIFMALHSVDRVPKNDQPLLAGTALVAIFYALDLLPNGTFNYLHFFFSGALVGLSQGMTQARTDFAGLSNAQRAALASWISSAQRERDVAVAPK